MAIDLTTIAAGIGGFVIYGQDASDSSGYSVASAGDVNGDGFDDLIIGVPAADAAGNAKDLAGDSYVIFGRAAGWGAPVDLATIAAGIGGFVIHGQDAGDLSGFSVASAGDLNGDGFADLIIGAPQGDAAGNAKVDAGDSYVVFGKASGWGAPIDLATIAAGSGGFVIVGQDAGDQAGRSVASAGDVNGDGFDDLIIGALYGDAAGNAKADAGDSYVVFGKASGWGAPIDLTTIAAGIGGFVILGQDAGDGSGFSVASAGDVNGDGFDDLLIGASRADAAGNAKANAGDSYVVFGKASGWGAAIDLAAVAAGAGGFVILGQDVLDQSGRSVASAGDVNGDGLADLIIGAFAADAAGDAKANAGDSYVVFGRAADWGAPIDLTIIAAGTGGFVIHGQDAEDRSGRSVASAGDVNGDGFDDLVIGASRADAAGNAKTDAGESYVVFGKASGWGAAIDLASIAAGTGGFVINGQDAGDYAGFSVASAGDLDGDGFDDLIIGARWGSAAGNAKTDAGESYVIFGRDFTGTVTQLGTAGGDTLSGTSGADVIVAGQGDDTILGLGGADALEGGAGNDRIAVGDLSFLRVDGGSGTDRLALMGSGLTLDLAAIPDTKLQGIEAIDLGRNALRLTALEVLNLSDTANTLRVTGEVGARLIFDDTGWARGATVDGFATYTKGQATLAVSLAVTQPVELRDVAAGIGGFVINGQDAVDQSGWSVASAGDVNGDGFADLVIGAYTADGAGNARADAGDSYVVFGKAAGWGAPIDLTTIAAGTGGFVIHGQDAGDRSGVSVASAGDVNGDGFADLIIGAFNGDAAGNAKTDAGDSYVVFGKASGWGAAIELATIAAGTGGFVINGQDPGDVSGYSVASAGDVNGDGIDDLIIGAFKADGAGNAKPDAGDSYVVFGKASAWGAAIDLATIAAGTGGFVINGQDPGDWSGFSVASAGDVNGDGVGDLTIGARRGDAAGNAKPSAGDSYVVFGKASGWGVAIDLADVAAGTGGFVIYGEDAGDRSGFSVASAGDVNGDGFGDLIIGAQGGAAAGNAKAFAGDSYVVFGKASGWSAAIELADIAAGTGGFVIHGEDGGDSSGNSVASAGDVNGDGFDDLIIGAVFAGTAGSATGDSYVVFGKATGWGAPVDLGTIAAGIGGFVIHGEGASDLSGGAVASAGDLDGDGFDDLIISAPLADAAGNAKPDAGESYVIFGRDFSGTVTRLGSAAGDTLSGTSSADVIVAGQGDDTILGQGGVDALAGGAGNDRIAASDLGFLRVDGGSGTDTLALVGGGLTLDLAAIPDTKLQGIEAIDLDANALRVTALEVLNLSDSSNTLRVTGTTGARLLFDDVGWAAGATVDGFATYTKGQATLLVADAVARPLQLGDVAAGIGGFVILGQDAGDQSGRSVASAGDVNGDGFDDLIIGAPYADAAGNAKPGAGESYVVFGKAAGWGAPVDLAAVAAGSGGFVIHGQDAFDYAGWPVASAGDVNGDGFDDLIIGAPYGDAAGNAKANAGDGYVVFGKAAGWGATLDLAAIAGGTGGFVIHGQDAIDNAGYSVASAGDVNGDGFDDLIIGAPKGDAAGNLRPFAGEGYVVFGKATGWGAPVDLAAVAAGVGGFVLLGQDSGDWAGWSLASAGDVNGDGFDDIVIGAFRADAADNAKSLAGESYVVFGKEAGWGAPLDLAAIALGLGGFVIHGAEAGDESGWSVAAAGDVNGDGFGDLIIGARSGDGPDNARDGAGDSYVVFGKAGGFGAAIDLAAVALGTGGFVIRGQDTGDQSGYSLASAGDVNGDGFDDLIIGARLADAAGNAKADAGDSYVVFGKAAGWGAEIDLAAVAAGAGGFVIQGQDAGDQSGFSVASAGDLDGDGFDDLIIGARLGDAAGNAKADAGESYVIFGRDFTGTVTRLGTTATETLSGTEGADVIVAGQGDDTILGEGGADALAGGAGNDRIAVADLSFLRVDGGGGTDSLVLAGAGQMLDLTAIPDLRLAGIEAIELGTNALRLTALEVLNLSDSSNTLRLLGGTEAGLLLGDAGWLKGASAGGFTSYAKGQARLEVQDGIQLRIALDLAEIAKGEGGFALYGQDVGDRFGFSVASAGDVNGDGFDDLIVGAYRGDAAANAKADAGESYVVFGKAGGWGAPIDLATIAAGTGGFVINGQESGDTSGYSVASAGDVNGDGFDDLIIGANSGDAAGNAKSSAGDSYVVFGKATGWGAAIDLATIAAGTGGFVILGQDAGDESGRSVASAGDVNGDGFDDLIIGAIFADAAGNAKANAGDSYVVFGKAGGWGAAIDLATVAAGTGGFVIHGQDAEDRSGFVSATGGDLNGDGFDDLIIGAFAADAAGDAKPLAGDSYVIFGKAAGWGAPVDLATIAAGTGGFVIHGQDAGDNAGRSVAFAGDVNGDGFEDLLIGARYGDAAGDAKTNAGDSYVVFGKSGGWGAPIDLATTAAGAGGFVIHGQDPGDLSGRSVAAAGDVNGDGLDDLIIGARLGDAAGNAKTNAGDSYVVFGKASGWGAPIDLTVIAAGLGGFVINGQDAENQSGFSVASAGDLDGDGFDDLVIGAYRADAAGNAKTDAGDSYVVFGRDFTGLITHAGTAAAETLTGTTGADVIVAGQGDDTILGNGGADALEGGAGNDRIVVADLGFLRVDGGSGTDTLALEGSGLTLDLAAIPDTKLQGIEAIDLGANVLRVTALEVLNLSDTANTLRVMGTTGARLLFDDTGWVAGATVDGVTTYTKGQAILLSQVIGPTEGADTLDGTSANDTIDAAGDNDLVRGLDGSDSLIGGAGTDTLEGGAGNDSYGVDAATDVVTEAVGGGNDTVFAGLTYSLAAGQEIEALVLTGTGNINGTGNEFANSITGNTGNNVLNGGGQGDSLAGGDGNDTLNGGGADDTMVGGAGADSLAGGGGDDRYVIDALDTIVDTAGFDTVEVGFTYTLATGLEALALTGAVAANGDGNAAANALTGNTGDNLLQGLGDNDTLLGSGGRDTLRGGDGNDSLDGGSNQDSLEGGLGDDTYVFTPGSDTVIDTGGIDTLVVGASFTLGADFENLVLSGGADIAGTGNAAANTITGNNGANLLSGLGEADTLTGGKGNDTLLGGLGADLVTGGSGKDVFRFASAAEGGDTIAGYSGKDDTVEVSALGFGGGLAAGMKLVTAGRYVSGVGAAANQSFGQFLFDTATSVLSWDADGTGAVTAVAIADLTGAKQWGGGEIAVIA